LSQAMSILSIHARQIFDSRGNPTIEVDVITKKGTYRAGVPSGASTGSLEAVELRDKDPARNRGKSVLQAVRNVNEVIGPALLKAGLKVTDQEDIDDLMKKLDGTPNKGKLGANAIVGVSMAVARAGAAEKDVPLYRHLGELAGVEPPFVLPTPAFNVLNGGRHAGNRLAIQEFMIVPTGAANFEEALTFATDVYATLKQVIAKKYGIQATNVGDEGGFAPDLTDAEEALGLINQAIQQAGYEGKVKIAMDAAASEFYDEAKKTYDLDFKNPKPHPEKFITHEQLSKLYLEYCEKFPVINIEDPFSEHDWEAWGEFLPKTTVQVVADDITVSNPKIIEEGIKKKVANALLLKVNQIGTVTESIQATQLAKKAKWGVMVSHRSGETEDTFIADLAVGLRTGQIKSGAPARSERVAKYNRLLRIEEELGGYSSFAGIRSFAFGENAPELL